MEGEDGEAGKKEAWWQRQKAGWWHCICTWKQRVNRKRGWAMKLQDLIHSDPFSPSRLCLLKVPQPSNQNHQLLEVSCSKGNCGEHCITQGVQKESQAKGLWSIFLRVVEGWAVEERLGCEHECSLWWCGFQLSENRVCLLGIHLTYLLRSPGAWINEWMGRWIKGCMGEWMDGWVGGWIRVCMHVWMNSLKDEQSSWGHTDQGDYSGNLPCPKVMDWKLPIQALVSLLVGWKWI